MDERSGENGEADDADLEDAYQSARSGEDRHRSRPDQYAYAIRMTAWAMALPVLMYVIGFANALVVFVLAFGLRFFDSPRQAVGVTILFSALMYLFFWQIIGLSPWTGILELPSIVDLLGLG